VAALAFGLFAAGIPSRFDNLLQVGLENQRVLADLRLSPQVYASYLIALDIVIVAAHLALAGLIFRRRSADFMALLVALALVTTPLAVIEAFPPTGRPWSLSIELIVYLGLTSSVIVLYLFPDGRFVPGWTRGLALLWAAINVPAVFAPGLPISLPTWPAFLRAAILVVWAATGVAAQVYRYYRVSDAARRRQGRWAILGLAAAALAPLGYYFHLFTLPSLRQTSPPTLFYNLADPAVFQFAFLLQLLLLSVYTAALLAFPFSFAIAILVYGLFEIEVVLNRTLVYTALTATIIGLYVVMVGGLGLLFQSQGNLLLAILATGLIAVIFQPLRLRLQQGVNRLMYGERDDPVTVLTRLGRQLEAAASPEGVLASLVQTVTEAMHLPYAAIVIVQDGEADEGDVIVAAGRSVATVMELPLAYQGQLIGRLRVAPRAPGEPFSPADQRLLEHVAQQAGAAVYAVRLTAALQHSRERLIAAREEERRRLHRDLHDGLGPQLATLNLKLDAARNWLARDPAAADRLLVELKGQTQAAIADIRRVVYDLRPAPLDQFGLVAAIREQARAYELDGGMRFAVEAPVELPFLPAAIEVAAYRIVLEAINNAARHAEARHCLVRLRSEGDLSIEVIDDGRGLPENLQPGVGLASMRERAEEVGGTFVVQARPEGGTAARAVLPLPPTDQGRKVT
jgi:signal transduction histidine kinase